jgi:type II secretory pathway pseudopilin PulG
VELLVVIGIIAVLIGILLPTLGRARANAMRVKCAAQLRQIGIATHIYANSNKGWIPPMHLEGTIDPVTRKETYDLWGAANNGGNWSYVQTNHWGKSPPDEVRDPGANLGRLIRTKALTNTDANWMRNEILFCPAADRGLTNNSYKNTYGYNLHLKKVSTSATAPYQRWWPRLQGYGRVKDKVVSVETNVGTKTGVTLPRMAYALGGDPINASDGIDFATHSAGRSRAWNLLYADGSVRTAISDQRSDGRQSGKWIRFLDVLGYLERLADGQEVQTPPKWGSYGLVPIDP